MKANWKFVGLILAAIFGLSTVGMVHATATKLATLPSIPVGNGARDLAYDSGKGEIFVSSGFFGSSNSIEVISDSNNTLVATITPITAPCAMAYDSGQSEIFVISEQVLSEYVTVGTVVVISDTNNTVVANITVGNTSPSEGIAYDSGKGEIFVANTNDNTVSVISDSTNQVVANISVENSPWCVAYDSGKGEIFVGNEASASVSVISDSTNQVVANITSGISGGPEGLAYDPAEGEIFVSDYSAGAFSVISDKNNVATAYSIEASGAPFTNPFVMGFDTGTGQAFLNCGESAADIISDKNNAVVAYFEGFVFGFAYDSGKGEMFIGGGSENVVYYLSDSSIPEFGSVAFFLVATAAMSCLVTLMVKAKKRRASGATARAPKSKTNLLSS